MFIEIDTEVAPHACRHPVLYSLQDNPIDELLRVYGRIDVHVRSQTSLSSATTSTDVCILTTLVSFTSA